MTLTLYPKEHVDLQLVNFMKFGPLGIQILRPTENRSIIAVETKKRIRLMYQITLQQYILVAGEDTNEEWIGMKILFDSKELN